MTDSRKEGCDIVDMVFKWLDSCIRMYKFIVISIVQDIIHNSAKTIEEKVHEVWEHAKDALKPVISVSHPHL